MKERNINVIVRRQDELRHINKNCRKMAQITVGPSPGQIFTYFALIQPFAVRASAHRTAPPAAPRTVLWDSPTNL